MRSIDINFSRGFGFGVWRNKLYSDGKKDYLEVITITFLFWSVHISRMRPA